MTTKLAQKCPHCGAPDKYPNKPKFSDARGYRHNLPTTYACGTVTSPDWAPPVYTKNCLTAKEL